MPVIEDTRTFRAPRPEVIDLRGSGSPPPTAVLADPTGRRAALLRTIGRVVAVVFVLWFCGLVVAGLGLLPLSDLPLAGALGPTSQPTTLRAIPRPKPPARRDLLPARPLAPRPAASTPAPRTLRPPVTRRVQHRPNTAAPAPPGRRLGTTQNQAGSPTSTVPATGPPTTPGNSSTAPGHNRTTTTTTTAVPGRSGTAPGHDPTATTGHGASLR